MFQHKWVFFPKKMIKSLEIGLKLIKILEKTFKMRKNAKKPKKT